MSALKKPEVLSPAGDSECFEAAIRYGADAVYLAGQSFGMRSAPKNFTFDELSAAVKMAHSAGKRVYLTCNTLPHNRDLSLLGEFLDGALSASPDAFIVSDIGVLRFIKDRAPSAEIHISTQAGVVNSLSASEFYKMGASRVVLARELTLDEIKTIRDTAPPELEIECFIHGAMCVSFSGRCLLSHYLTGRDANRGECAQPCRWNYAIMEKTREGEYYPISEEDGGTYILNAEDLCMIDRLDSLMSAGISSFKIEGRAKSPYYTAVITNAYRCAVDFFADNPGEPLPDWIITETEKVSHRRYSHGFYFSDDSPAQNLRDGGYIRSFDVAAEVISSSGGGLEIIEKNRFYKGDELEAVLPGRPPQKITVERIYDMSGAETDTANKAAERYKITCGIDLPAGTFLRMKKGE